MTDKLISIISEKTKDLYYSKDELKNISDDLFDKKIEQKKCRRMLVEYTKYSKNNKKYYIDFDKKRKTKLSMTLFVPDDIDSDDIYSDDSSDDEPIYDLSLLTIKSYENDHEIIKNTNPPYGSQWIHDEQIDDEITPEIANKTKILEKLQNIILPKQRSKEWFEMRENKITASDGGTVLGQSPYDAQYKFILKKTTDVPFLSNRFCYHGKKMEEIATMIYAYRMNISIDEFGLLGHDKYSFLGASPDGICNKYKADEKTLSKYVGRMLEIKCPLSRQILTEGEIKGGICPIYYWIQVQLQLECCDLDECDFWQCNIREYSSKQEFENDTKINEPYKSIKYGFEKGCLVQIIPKDKMNLVNSGQYFQVIHEFADFIHPPKIEMTPLDCENWSKQVIENLEKTHPEYVLDKILYWRLENSHNVTINRDKVWFEQSLPEFEKMWNYVLFLRSNNDKMEIFLSYINSLSRKSNEKIMKVLEKLYTKPDFDDKLKKIIKENEEIMKNKKSENIFDECLF